MKGLDVVRQAQGGLAWTAIEAPTSGRHEPDDGLFDLRMPVLNCIDALRRIHEHQSQAAWFARQAVLRRGRRPRDGDRS